ncbi:hypothetical protein [Actinomyces radicidentis]|uniref:hypothetical protein n=1 Tax=Actinomyces radicidentis TaxID=111015 RepID=UPI0026DFCCFE|nr:hypothetical protein [Actinomyces radicidentis]
MSTTTTTLDAPAAVGAARVRRPSVLRAELLRQHRTFTWGASLVGLAVALFYVRLAASATSQGLASAQGRWDGNVLGWLSFYPFAVLVPLGALTGALAEFRECRCRQGGTAWRDVSGRRVVLARLSVLALGALACQVAVFGPAVLQSLLTGQGWGPVGTWSTLVVLLALAQAASASWGLLAARLLRGAALGVAPVLGFVWSAVGAVRAESPSWAVEPWTWTVRSLLPLMGVHGNSVNLEPGAAAWSFPVWPAFPLTLLLGALAVLALLALERPGRTALLARRSPVGGSRRSAPRGVAAPSETSAPVGDVLGPDRAEPSSAAVRPASSAVGAPSPHGAVWSLDAAGLRRRPATARALAPALPWGTWAALSVLLLAAVAVVHVVYSPARATDVLALLGVPVAGAAVGTMAWHAVAEPWRLLVTRRSPGRLVTALVSVPAAVLGAVLVVVGVVAAVGAPVVTGGSGSPLYAVLTAPFVAAMVVAVTMAVAQRLGLGAAIALTVFGVLDSLVVAGNEALSGALWRWAPWGWSAVAASHPGTWTEVVLLSVLVTVVALLVLRSGWRRAARAGAE